MFKAYCMGKVAVQIKLRRELINWKKGLSIMQNRVKKNKNM